MKEIDTSLISQTIAQLCVQANHYLPADIEQALRAAQSAEPWPLAQNTLNEMVENTVCAAQNNLPICQDTGMACVFIRLGQNVHLTGIPLQDAVNSGVKQGYGEGLLRKSVVADPLLRKNTGDNTPALLTVEIVPGENVEITVAPKGFGSENMSRLAMLKPADGQEGVEDFILETVRLAGPNPCPPIVVGVGIGGSFDRVALLAKEALLRPLTIPNANPFYAEMEQRLLRQCNELGIGPAGYGGKTTVLGVSIETAPTHIAGLPVAVNISCHVTRRASATL